MNLVDRVKNILMQPQQEWPVIAAESTDTKTLYTGYIMILAAIPAIVTVLTWMFLGSLFGRMGAAGGLGFGLGAAILGYVLSLAMVYVVALIADALAPSFDGEKNVAQSLKLVAYSMTASWVGAIFNIIPLLGWILSILAALYGIYIFYTGVGTMKKVPEAKVVGYTAVVIIVAIIVGVIAGTLTTMVMGMGMMGSTGMRPF
jgi:Yip1-like protein